MSQRAQPDATKLKTFGLEELSAIEVTTPSREPRAQFETPAAIFVPIDGRSVYTNRDYSRPRRHHFDVNQRAMEAGRWKGSSRLLAVARAVIK